MNPSGCSFCGDPECHDGEPCPSHRGYENAPQTRLLATHCAVCRRPLCDAKSVELGIGPDCRRRFGFDVEVSEEARIRANRLVWEVAVDRRVVTVLGATTELRLLGFTKLADTLQTRTATVKVTEEDDRLVVEAPYSEESVALMRSLQGRRWDGERKVNTFPAHLRAEVWQMLRRAYPGTIGIGPKGAFEIKPLKPANAPA